MHSLNSGHIATPKTRSLTFFSPYLACSLAPPPPPAILDVANEWPECERTSTEVAPPPEVAVVVVLVDHLRERQEETQPANRRARTSCRCLTAPRPACETIRLMGFWSMKALRSAWFGRRRTHLLAKHGAVVVLQDGLGGQGTHGREWPKPLDGR
jgi:hypothetical protein